MIESVVTRHLVAIIEQALRHLGLFKSTVLCPLAVHQPPPINSRRVRERPVSSRWVDPEGGLTANPSDAGAIGVG